jgi:hypothetical protein
MAKKPNSGTFKKGKPPGPGRGKGTPNKSTKAFREVMAALLDANEENFSLWIKRIAKKNPDAAMLRLLQAAEFVAPKLNRTEVSGVPGGAPLLVKQLTDDITADTVLGAGFAEQNDSEAVSSDPSGNQTEQVR